jgi:hypothetical protein
MSIGNTTRTKIANFAPMDYERFFSADVPSFLRSPVREIFRKVDLQAICSFAGGYPAAVTFPTDQIPSLAAAVLEKYGTRALQYGATQGVPELRAAIAARYGVPVSQVQITTSSQQGIDVCSRVFLDPGDIVLAQSPVYLGALQSFRAYRSRVEEVALCSPTSGHPRPDKREGPAGEASGRGRSEAEAICDTIPSAVRLPVISGQTNSVRMIKPALRQCSNSLRPSTTKRPCSRRALDFSCSRSKFLILGFWAEVMVSIRTSRVSSSGRRVHPGCSPGRS